MVRCLRYGAIAVSIALLIPSALVIANGTFYWEDDFLDWSKIDRALSYNIELKDSKVIMKNTYKAWYYPWPKMREIHINNTGPPKEAYVLPLEVHREPEMQADYSDLRFVYVYDDKVYDLEYWVGDYDDCKADVWIRIVPELPSGESVVYMFYGDPNAPSNSNFDIVFKWDDRTDPDVMISYKNYREGAWDPDVAFGGGRFLVAWEERLGPEDRPYYMERASYSDIRGRTYNSDGKDPQPPPETDTDIEIMVDKSRHGEDPSIASDGNKFFVVWEENPADITRRFEIDIKGAIVTPDGKVTPLSEPICDAPDIQEDACVAYSNGRYLVVWEDRREGPNNYNVWGRFYDRNGNPLSDEFQITHGANYEGQPWVCGDKNGFFLVVYEFGDDCEDGPFGIKATKLDPNGVEVWTKTIVVGTEDRDNVWPAVNYNPYTDEYLVTWNDGDLSAGKPRGNVWGAFLDQDGNMPLGVFKIQSGNNYIRTDVVPYLEKMFFVSYDKGDELWGKLVYNKNGKLVMTSEQPLSDGSSENVDWNNLAVSDDGKIFAVWEDERDQASEYADAFGSVWHIYKTTGSPDVSYSFGEVKELVTEAALYSKILDVKELNVEKWQRFYASYGYASGNIVFYVLDSSGNVLKTGLGDISDLPVTNIRLKAVLSRDVASDTPWIDKWGVEYIGEDTEPPWTLLFTDPEEPNGENGWFTTYVEVELRAYDNGSGVDTIYYSIDGDLHSSKQNPCTFIVGGTGEHEIEYWSVDKAGNAENPKKKIIKIDGRPPKVYITKPKEDVVEPGDVTIEFTVDEEGSGIARAAIYINDELMKEWFTGEERYVYTFTVGSGESYKIEAKVWDVAGNVGGDFKMISTKTKAFSYYPEIGYWYSSVERKPSLLLAVLGCSVVTTPSLTVKIKPREEIDEVKFVIDTVIRSIHREGIDTTKDAYGYYSYSFYPPIGIYQVKAIFYSGGIEKDSFTWPGYIVYL